MPTKKSKARPTARGTKAKTATKKAKPKAATPALRTITPYLAVNDAARAIEWYKAAFGAKEKDRIPSPGGKLMHAELKVGDSSFFLSDIFPGADVVDPTRAGPSVNLHLFTKNVDKLWNGAIANGAKVTMPLDDQFWGDRYGKLIDPFGHSWALSYKSKLSKAELEKKREQAMREFGAPPS